MSFTLLPQLIVDLIKLKLDLLHLKLQHHHLLLFRLDLNHYHCRHYLRLLHFCFRPIDSLKLFYFSIS